MGQESHEQKSGELPRRSRACLGQFHVSAVAGHQVDLAEEGSGWNFGHNHHGCNNLYVSYMSR